MGLVLSLYLEDVDPRLAAYLELRGARQALQELLAKYDSLLPEEVKVAVRMALNDVNAAMGELERELLWLLPEPEKVGRVARGEEP